MRALETAGALALAIVVAAVVCYILYICFWVVMYATLAGIGVGLIYLIYKWIR